MSPIAETESTVTRFAPGFMQPWINSSIASGKVAENNHVLFRPFARCRIFRNSSRNPMLNISSASSSTRCCTASSFSAFRRNNSSNLPGVATTICVGRRIRASCFGTSSPPLITSTNTFAEYFV